MDLEKSKLPQTALSDDQNSNIDVLRKRNTDLRRSQEILQKDLKAFVAQSVDDKVLEDTIQERTQKYLELQGELKSKSEEVEKLKLQVKELEGLSVDLIPLENPNLNKLIDSLKQDGHIKSSLMEKVMRSIDRKDFCPAGSNPYTDGAQPIGYNTTISAPHMHATQLEMIRMNLRYAKKALDIGCGSGYFTLAMTKLMPEGSVCIGIDHVDKICDQAKENVKKNHADLLEKGRIEFITMDGRKGYETEAPFDVIFCGGAVEEIPKEFIDQLSNNGCLLLPVGKHEQLLTLVYKKDNGEVIKHPTKSVMFGKLQDLEEQCPDDD